MICQSQLTLQVKDLEALLQLRELKATSQEKLVGSVNVTVEIKKLLTDIA